METNLYELEDIVRLGVELGVDRIKGHHLWTNFHQIESLSLRRNKESIKRWNSVVLNIKNIVKGSVLPNGKWLSLVNFDILEEGAIKNLSPDWACPFLGNEAWIAPDGRFSPCCAPDILRRKLGNFGNVNERNITDILYNQAYQELLKNYMQNEVCIACNMRRL